MATSARIAPAAPAAHACYGDGLHAEPIAALPEIDVVAHAEIQKPQPGLAIPFRDGALNLYLGYKGAKSVSVDGAHYTLSGGDYFLTPPGIRHPTPTMAIGSAGSAVTMDAVVLAASAPVSRSHRNRASSRGVG